MQVRFDESRSSGDNRKVAFLQHVGLWRSLGARFHGMEEVVGSIPTRSTNRINNLTNQQEKRDTLKIRCFSSRIFCGILRQNP